MTHAYLGSRFILKVLLSDWNTTRLPPRLFIDSNSSLLQTLNINCHGRLHVQVVINMGHGFDPPAPRTDIIQQCLADHVQPYQLIKNEKLCIVSYKCSFNRSRLIILNIVCAYTLCNTYTHSFITDDYCIHLSNNGYK